MHSKFWRWAEVVANSAPYAFWTIWGAGAGAFGAVFFKAVDVGGDALRVYMAILTVMMGGGLGLVSSRAMDRLADARKTRRQIQIARSRIRALRYHLDVMIALRAEGHALMDRGEPISARLATKILATGDGCRTESANIPSLDEVIDTEEDVLFADRLVGVFTRVQTLTAWVQVELGQKPNEYWVEKARPLFIRNSQADPFVTLSKIMTDAEEHFQGKL